MIPGEDPLLKSSSFFDARMVLARAVGITPRRGVEFFNGALEDLLAVSIFRAAPVEQNYEFEHLV